MPPVQPLQALLYRISISAFAGLTLATSIPAQASGTARTVLDSRGISKSRDPSTASDPKPVPPPLSLEGRTGFTAVPGDEPDFTPSENPDPTGSRPDTLPILRKGEPYVLAFTGGSFAPERGIDLRLLRLRRKSPSGFTYGYVMLRGRMADEKKVRGLQRLGVEILGVHTWQSYVARIPLAELSRIAALPFVHWVGHAQPDQKLEPSLRAAIQARHPKERFRVDISVFASDLGEKTVIRKQGELSRKGRVLTGQIEIVFPHGPMHEALEALGYRHDHYNEIGNVHIFEGSATAAQILEIRKLDFVAYIELKQIHHSLHDQSVAMIGQDRVRGDYDGSGITLGVIDTGLSNAAGGGTYKTHKDLLQNLAGWSNIGSSSAATWQDADGHGTHVAGTMVGMGRADIRYRGMAPGVGGTPQNRLFVGRYLDGNGKSVGSASTLFKVMSSTVGSGSQTSARPRAINNSWGTDATSSKWSGTESSARSVDNYVYRHRQTYVFAAGNKGIGVGSPGSSKNALTVGSVDDYWTSKIRPGDLSAFSQGGTSDWRHKPEICAPGDAITSTKTKTTDKYTTLGGTSMAAPHVTGAIASFLQKWKATYDYRPHRIKAQMLASAGWQGSDGAYSGFRVGYGLIDAYKMANSSPRYSWVSSWSARPLTSSGKYFYTDITVPKNITNAKLVMSYIEQATSGGSKQARVSDVRVFIDIAPFSAGGNTGEIELKSTKRLNLSIAGSKFANSIRGKKLRIKVYGQSVPFTYLPHAAWTLFYYKKPITGQPTLNVAMQSAKVLRNQVFAYVATLESGNEVREFSNARIYPDFPEPVKVVALSRKTLDKKPITQRYLEGRSYPSWGYPSTRKTTLGGMTVGSGYKRTIVWFLQAPSVDGIYSLKTYCDFDLNPKAPLRVTKTLCVDSSPPNDIAQLRSTSHSSGVWSRSSQVQMAWTKATDVGCARVTGLATLVTDKSYSNPSRSTMSGAKTGIYFDVGETPGKYFHIRAIDGVGNLSKLTGHWGPIRVDKTPPSLKSVSINDRADRTNNLKVTLRLSASDALSGVASMRFSSDGKTWGPWKTYTSAPMTHDLSTLGGNSSPGAKNVFSMVRDRAGNTSNTRLESILYVQSDPLVTLIRIQQGAKATKSLSVMVEVHAQGNTTAIQYSSDGSTWSAWKSYSKSPRSYDLSKYGGNSKPGLKYVYARVRDGSQKLSLPQKQRIWYVQVPNITSAQNTTFEVIHDQAIRLTGSGFNSVGSAHIGSLIISSRDPEDWHKGYLRILSDTKMEIHPPQALQPGTYSCYLRNIGFASRALTLQVRHNSRSLLALPPRLKTGKVLHIYTHLGPKPTTTISILSISTSPRPWTLPGFLSMGHGGHPVFFIDPSFTVTSLSAVHDANTRVAQWALPTPAGRFKGTFYWQCLMFDITNTRKSPIPVSTVDSVQLY